VPLQLVFVPMLFVAPAGLLPLCVALGLILGALPDVRRQRLHGERLLVQLVNAWHAIGPAAVLLVAGEPDAAPDRLPLFAVALAAQFACELTISSIRGRLAFGMTLRERIGAMAVVYLVDAALAPVGFAIAVAAATAPAASLLGAPLIGLLAFFARERQKRIDAALELSHAYRGTALLLGDVIEADDAYTGSHSRDVVELVLAVADELGLPPRERRNAELAALLHDVGKIRIPNEIINKPGKLTDEEWALIETHTVEGERLLAKVGGVLGDVGHIIRSCHERWDGGGYPDGLVGERIPQIARIVMCCDAFNAMTTDRSYRKARPVHEAVEELRRNSGTQFDPGVVEALIRRLAVPPQEH
jgi:HD-GYP domain-containing protein (c-di-GMP phosphodiesterase class II)